MFVKHILTLLAVGAICFKDATAQHYPITGVHTGINNKTGARPARRNINDLQKDTVTWYEKQNTWNLKKKLLISPGLCIFKRL
jgi:hypothetical protein